MLKTVQQKCSEDDLNNAGTCISLERIGFLCASINNNVEPEYSMKYELSKQLLHLHLI